LRARHPGRENFHGCGNGYIQSDGADRARLVPDSIPPFPGFAEGAEDDGGTETSLIDLCNRSSDHAFSTAVLKIANSPLVGFPKTSPASCSIHSARLRRLRSVAITVGLKTYFGSSFTR